MFKFLSLFLLFYFPLNAKLIETKNPNALCSNGEQATFTFFEGNSTELVDTFETLRYFWKPESDHCINHITQQLCPKSPSGFS